MKIERIPFETFRTLKFAGVLSTDEFLARCKGFDPDLTPSELRRIQALAEQLSLDTYEQLQAVGITNLEIKVDVE